MQYTRKMLCRLSEEQLIDIILAQQDEIVALKQQVAALQTENAQFRARLAELERVVGMNSRNSSKPPSSDPPNVDKSRKPRQSKRKRGAQPGHEGHHREPLPEDQVDEITQIRPDSCKVCGRALNGQSAWYTRHQVWEIPEIEPHVHEYQLYGLSCDGCGAWNTASLPQGVPTGAFGPRLQATIGILSGVYRLSKRSVQSVLKDFFGIPIGLGSICACESLVSEALSGPVAEAWEHMQSAQMLHADETGWHEHNRKAWMWVAATQMVTVFMIHAKRGQVAARELLGTFSGILVTDRRDAV